MATNPVDRMAGQEYVYPGFARWFPAQAKLMTDFLFSDPSNPFASQPENWKRAGVVRTVNKTITSGSLTNGSNSTTDFRPSNGRNYIILARQAVCISTTATLNSDLVLAQQTQQDGTILDDEAPLSNLFGSGELQFVLAVPDLVLGTATRRWKITNNTGSTGTTHLTFQVAYLDLIGR